MVIDYRKLNQITISDKYPIPEINEVLYNLGKNKYITNFTFKGKMEECPSTFQKIKW